MESRDRHYRRDSYIEGNVVRQRECVPGRSVQPAEKTREQLHQERMRKNAARQNQQRAMAMDRGYVAFLAAATGCLFSGLCHFYLSAVRCDHQNGKYCID